MRHSPMQSSRKRPLWQTRDTPITSIKIACTEPKSKLKKTQSRYYTLLLLYYKSRTAEPLETGNECPVGAHIEYPDILRRTKGILVDETPVFVFADQYRRPRRLRHKPMNQLLALLDFAGYVALLLWGVHMVQSGVQRAFGNALGIALGHALGTRIRAFAAGLGITAAIQSSTATGLMITGFAAGGLVALAPALAAMLGANVGTTLIVQLLSFNQVGS